MSSVRSQFRLKPGQKVRLDAKYYSDIPRFVKSVEDYYDYDGLLIDQVVTTPQGSRFFASEVMEVLEDVPRIQKNKFIAVEANIGVGKSTLLPKLAEALSLHSGETWKPLQEPVDDPEFDRLLRKFYSEGTTEARIEFQYYITDRRWEICQALPDDCNYVIERSLFSDLIFCQSNFLPMEAPSAPYMNYFYRIKDKLDDYPKLGACVYLDSDPKTAYKRMQERGREAEEGVSLEYLEDLHYFHKACLPQTCRFYKTPLLTYDWNDFGCEHKVAMDVLRQFD